MAPELVAREGYGGLIREKPYCALARDGDKVDFACASGGRDPFCSHSARSD